MSNNKTALLLRPKQPLLDVTDKSLYPFNGQSDSMTVFREASSVEAFDRFFSIIESDEVKSVVYIVEKVPTLKKVFDSFIGNPELVAKLSANAQQKLESGEWRWLFAKDGSGMISRIYDDVAKNLLKNNQN
jgi:hypothetical protein